MTDVKIISFGYRCSGATLLQNLELKHESYPFDWLVSKLNVIEHCIETNFIEFLNVDNYITLNTKTYNTIDNQTYFILDEISQINTFYDKNTDHHLTYDYNLAISHHNMSNNDDYEYYKRCIKRLYELLETDNNKNYIYLHPLMGMNDFDNKKDEILTLFEHFNNFILTKTKNIFGLYFILVRNNDDIKSIKLIETQTYVLHIIHFNDNLFDAANPFMGIGHLETGEILTIIRKYAKSI